MGIVIAVDPARWGRRSEVAGSGNCVATFAVMGNTLGGEMVTPGQGSTVTYVFGGNSEVTVQGDPVPDWPCPSGIADDPLWWALLSGRRNAVLHRLVSVHRGVYLTACGKYALPEVMRMVPPSERDCCLRCAVRGWT